MKLLSSLINRIELIAFFLGFVAGIYIFFAPARYFITWHALTKAPEPIVKIISANHMGDVIVQTISNKKFLCNIYNEKECWTEIDYDPWEIDETLCFREDCPGKHTVQMTKATALVHSFVALSTIHSLNDDGIIYVKHKGVVLPDGYMMGAIIGGFCALLAFLGKHVFLGINSLFQKAQVK